MHHSSPHYQSISSRSRISSSHNSRNVRGNGSRGPNSRISNHHNQSHNNHQSSHPNHDHSVSHNWSTHRSSSGKTYYYNTKTGISQWEMPTEVRQHQNQNDHHHQTSHHNNQHYPHIHHRRGPNNISPHSDISESSSIRQQQDISPSSSASTHTSAQSDSVLEDKPLLTPSLAQYFKPELIVHSDSSQVEELERSANLCSKEALILNDKVLKESVELKIAQSIVLSIQTKLKASEERFDALREAADNYGYIPVG